jgi:hypothetical protein
MTKKSRKELKREERQQSREARQRESENKAKARKRKKILSYLYLGAAVLLIAVALISWMSRDLPGESFPSQGNRHVAVGSEAQFPYNTNPPTSGPHYGGIARWGIHKRPVRKGLQVHNLEDGGVVIQYRCRNCPDLIAKLEGIGLRYPKHVIVAPYPKMKPLIALTAWTRIDRLDKFDEKRIVRFIEAYQGLDHHRR